MKNLFLTALSTLTFTVGLALLAQALYFTDNSGPLDLLVFFVFLGLPFLFVGLLPMMLVVGLYRKIVRALRWSRAGVGFFGLRFVVGCLVFLPAMPLTYLANGLSRGFSYEELAPSFNKVTPWLYALLVVAFSTFVQHRFEERAAWQASGTG